MLVRLANVVVSLADDLVCPIFVCVCPTFGHGSLANVFFRPPDVVFSPPDDDFLPDAYVSEPDGDDFHAHAYVSEPAEHVSEAEDYVREADDDVFGTVEYVREAAEYVREPENYLCESDDYVEAGAGDDGQRGGVRRAATDSGPFRAGTISGKAGFGLKAHNVTAWGEAPGPRTQIIPQPCKGETSIGPAFQALGEIGAAHYLRLRSSDSLQPRLSHGGLSALAPVERSARALCAGEMIGMNL